MASFPISEFPLLLGSDFSGVFDLFRYVLLAPFFGIGLGAGFFIGVRMAAGRNRIVGPIVMIASVLLSGFLFAWIGNQFINLMV